MGLEVNQFTEAPLSAGPTHCSWFWGGGGIRVDMHIQGFLFPAQTSRGSPNEGERKKKPWPE